MTFLLAAILMMQTPSATGSVRGTVVLASSQSQAPLTMARVELYGGPMRPQIVRTDGEGRFLFENLVPGSYRLVVTRDSYIRQEYAKHGLIVIKAGEAHKPVVIAMDVAPTLAGHVQNENGEPVANILVEALKGAYEPSGRRTFTPFASTLTDDHGEYRLYWLDPGEYIIRASYVPAIKTPGNPKGALAQVVYASTYFPGVADLSNAQRITLKADQNDLTRDFRLTKVPTVTVRGSTTTKENRRAPGASITACIANAPGRCGPATSRLASSW